MQKHNISGRIKHNKIIFCLALVVLLLTSCNSKNTDETAPDTSADTQKTEAPEESTPALTESDIDEVMQRYFEYEEYTVYSSASVQISAETVEMDSRVYNRVTDERFDDWNEWLNYIGNIYCGDLLIEKIEGQNYFTGVDGKTYVMPGEMGWYISQEYTSEYSANDDGSYNVKIFRNKKNPGFDDIICEYNYIFTHTDNGWRISGEIME